MNFIEEIDKFNLIKGTDAYEMAKIEVLLRLDKVLVAVRNGSIAVFLSEFGKNKSIYIYTNKEFIDKDVDTFEEISLEKFDIILRNKGNNFNSCIINHQTPYSIELSSNIPYFTRRYSEIYGKPAKRNIEAPSMKNELLTERIYLVVREAVDINNIDFFTRESGNENFAYLYTSPSQENNRRFKEALYGCKLAGLDWKYFRNSIVPELKEKKVTKFIIDFGAGTSKILALEELEPEI